MIAGLLVPISLPVSLLISPESPMTRIATASRRARVRSALFAVTTLLAVALAGCTTRGPALPTTVSNGVLADRKGMTLYTFDKDPAGKSVCNAACAKVWPPLMATASDRSSGNYTVIIRDDGSLQWAYKGKALYTWAKDSKPGDRTGDGWSMVWSLARP